MTTPPKKPTLFFFIRNAGYLQTYRSMIRALLACGYVIVGAFDPSPGELNKGAQKTLDAFAQQNHGFRWVKGIRRGGVWKYILRPVRDILSYRRFLLLPKRAPFYEALCFKFLPHFLQRGLRLFPSRTEHIIKSKMTETFLHFIEWLAPPAPEVLAQLRKFSPVAVLVAFRNRPSSAPDLDYLKAARILHIPTVVPTPSWDNISSKGLMQILPDLLLVWNKEQAREAVEHHHMPRARIHIVGAYQFDDWIALAKPTLSRDAFCRRVGIPPEEPYILYLGSGAVTGDRAAVVDELRTGMDESGIGEVARASLVVRPAPNNFAAFAGYHRKGVFLVPPAPVSLSTPEGIELLLKTIEYAAAAVTIHTTGIIDAMLRGKPGLVMLRPEYEKLQHAEHFAHLVRSGAVATFHTGAEFARIVADVVRGVDNTKHARAAFLREYIQPRGTVRRAGEYAADDIERLIKERHKK